MPVCLIEDAPCERPACAPALDDPDAGRWWIAFCKSNRHYDFIAFAAQQSIDYYIPLAERVHTGARHRRRVSTYALFGSYAFIRGDEFMPANALGTHMLRQVIPVVDQAKLRADLANLERCLNAKGGRRVERCDVAVIGRRVRVAEGPFEGVCGRVSGRRGNSELLLIEVEGIMGGAVMELGAEKLEPAD